MLKTIFFLFALKSVLGLYEDAQPSSACLNAFRSAVYPKHDKYRQLHNVPALVADPYLEGLVQNYTVYLASQNLWKGYENYTIGQNYYFAWGRSYDTSVSKDTVNCLYGDNAKDCQTFGESAIDYWYNEIANYDFNKPGYNDSYHEFTQVVWKSTKLIGCGLGLSKPLCQNKAICFYLERGNLGYPENFALQVLPPKKDNVTVAVSTTKPTNSPSTYTNFTPTTNCLNAFNQAIVSRHNYYRQKHGVVNLTVDMRLQAVAQNYSNYLATYDITNHSHYPGLGENLFEWGGRVQLSINQTRCLYGDNMNDCATLGKLAVDWWYNESSKYNWSHPENTNSLLDSGHFTNVVWKATSNVGCGIAFLDRTCMSKVSCEYSPQGNLVPCNSVDIGKCYYDIYSANVLPPKYR